jgi:hypothetical protein
MHFKFRSLDSVEVLAVVADLVVAVVALVRFHS